MSRYIDADALNKRVSELIVPDWTRTLIRSWLDSEPTVDAVPWEFLERYADWFCASVSFPQFIQEAKAFYSSSVAAMDDFIITDGERKDDGTTVD